MGVHKPKIKTIVKKVPLMDQPVKSCGGAKGQAPKKAPKPVKKAQVVNALKLDRALGVNILALKSYSLAAHDFLKAKLLSDSKLSALGSFIYQYGSSKMDKSNAPGEYLALEAQYREFFCGGIGKYLVKQLNDAMRKKGGVLQFGKAKGKNVVMLNFKRVGLSSSAHFLKQWAVSSLVYNKYITQTVANSKSLTNVGKFSTCKKWFAYDKAEWCIVNDGCKGAYKNA